MNIIEILIKFAKMHATLHIVVLQHCVPLLFNHPFIYFYFCSVLGLNKTLINSPYGTSAINV